LDFLFDVDPVKKLGFPLSSLGNCWFASKLDICYYCNWFWFV